jgi:hypothetical protein
MPNEPIWIWEDDLKRYRNTKTGRFIGISQMQDLRAEYMEQQKTFINNRITEYMNNPSRSSVKALNKELRNIIKETYIDMYAMGAGGRNGMSQRDWGRIGAMVKEQYKYLDNLIDQAAKGQISAAQANARLKMYINSANEALWKGYTNQMPSLPAYPGDGSTVCLVNCQCQWDIQQVEGGFNCYWRLGAAEHCPDCMARASDWNPLFIPYGL